MKSEDVKKLLSGIAEGVISVEEGMRLLSHMPYLGIEGANLDIHRPLRNGFSEVIFGEGKNFEQIRGIVAALLGKNLNVFASRVSGEAGSMLAREFENLEYNKSSRTFKIIVRRQTPVNASIAVCCAGTADIPVAEEAYETAKFYGVSADRHYDIGVAGLHRIISKADEIKKSDVIIAVAGMEGALPSVMGGMFAQPIIAVPTSIGYGVNAGGANALMSMLGSCAEGISVVNIDNGFGAACSAMRIINRITDKK